MSATIEELPATPVPAGRPFVLRPSVREALWGFVFIGPWLIGLVLFIAGPMIASLVMSLTDFNLVHPETTKFIGIDNYVRMTNDPTIGQSLIATLKFALLAIPITMGASLGFALLLNHPKLPAKGPLRTLVYMPMMIPLVASTLVWIGFLNTETGWLNQILGSLGLPQPDWINSETWIYPALSMIGLWAIGNFMIINIAGLQSVPTELYEAATHRRRGHLAILPPDHDPADVAGAVLQPRDRPDRHVPVLHPGVRDDQRAEVTRTTRRCSSTSCCSAKASCSTTWATRRRSPGCCSSSCWC